MVYMGSKRRIAKDLIPFILKNRQSGQYWVEPFVGGGNIIDKVSHKRIGADINPNVISALKAIRDNIDDLPKNNREFSEEDYNRMKNGWNYKYKGYAGFAFSFGGKWMAGWHRCSEGRDYVAEAYRNALRQSYRLKGVKLVNVGYQDLEIPKNSLVYCDPPYLGATKYKTGDFNHDEFWQWCRDKSKDHTLFVSEYNAPSDFGCVWSKKLVGFCGGDAKGEEKLFRYCG